MAKTRPRLNGPKGEKISVGPERRAWFAARRVELGLGQLELGKKVGASQGTISNLENGKHTQIYRSVYAGLIRVLGKPPGDNTDDLQRELADEFIGMSETDLQAMLTLARVLKQRK